MRNKRVLEAGVWAAGMLCALGGCSLPGARSSVLVIAHRGNSSASPENTLAAFQSAADAKADMIELDARPSADGTLYVLHDATLDRTTNAVEVLGQRKIAINKTSDRDLARLDAGRWFDARFVNEKLPTLADALDVIQREKKTLLEVKDGPAQSYARLLNEKKLVDRLVVQSFNWTFLKELHEAEPRVALGALGDKELTPEKLEKIAATGARTVAWHHEGLNETVISMLKGKGYAVWAWTVDDPAQWKRLLEAGIDGIITNRPAELRKFLDSAG